MNKTISKESKAYLIPYPVESFSKPILIASKQTYIGRDPKGGIQIANKTISRQHARITSENRHFFLEDLGSQNGTFLNDERIKKASLSSHDKITVGNRTFLFLLQRDTINNLLLNPSVSATDTIAISNEEIDLSDLWAQNTEFAARGFIQHAAIESFSDSLEPDKLAHLRLSMLYRLSENLRTTNDIEEIYEKGLDLVMEAILAASCALIVLKSVSDDSFKIVSVKLRDQAQTGGGSIPISHTLFDWVFREKVTLVSENVSEDLRFQDSDSIRIHNLRSIVCVPIIGKHKVIGLLYAQSHNLLNPISKEDAVFASAVANELALNIDNIRLQATALRNERMAAIGLTVSNLAHNIRNLIALSNSASQLMDGHVEDLGHPLIERHWQWIQQSLSGINQLSSDILEYVKEDQLRIKSIDINKFILKYSKSIKGSLSGEGVNLDLVLSKKNPLWPIDEVQFQRALLNLVINAADALKGRQKGRIRISTSVLKNLYLVVSVADNGCGIHPRKMDKVLELFFTTKGTKGTGLGLPMVQKFVEKSGGKLKFQSKEGIGSIFQMIFPKM